MTVKAQISIGAETTTMRPRTGVPPPQRISRDELFLRVAEAFAERSTCLRADVGCVAVKDKHILAHGYNGAPAGMPQCDEVGCGGGILKREAQLDPLPGGEMPRPAEKQDLYEFPDGCTRIIHAEANAVAYAARVGVSLDGATVYCTHMPCLHCAKLLIAAGVVTVIYKRVYRITEGVELLDRANIEVIHYGSED